MRNRTIRRKSYAILSEARNKVLQKQVLIRQPSGFTPLGDILQKFPSDEDKYISREFQKYGYELAKTLGDLKNKSLYIKLAKDTPRAWLEQAKNFVKDAYDVESPPKLFMWKLTQIKREKQATKSP